MFEHLPLKSEQLVKIRPSILRLEQLRLGGSQSFRKLWATSNFYVPESWHAASSSLKIHSYEVFCEPHSYLTLCAGCVLTDTHFCMYGDETVIIMLKCWWVNLKEISGRVTRNMEFFNPELKYFFFFLDFGIRTGKPPSLYVSICICMYLYFLFLLKISRLTMGQIAIHRDLRLKFISIIYLNIIPRLTWCSERSLSE